MILGGSSVAGVAESGAPHPRVMAPVRLRERLAAGGFILLFPVFVLYHYGISAGWWSAVMGGMFGAATALVAALAIVSVPLTRRPSERLSSMHVVFLMMLAYMAAWSLANLPFVPYRELRDAVLAESFATLIIWIAVFFIGAQFPRDAGAISRVNTVGMLLIVLCFGHAFYDGGFPAGPFLAFANADEGDHSTYQGIGRSLLAVGTVAAVARDPYSVRAMVVLIATALLLLALGSRAHFFVLCLVLVLQMLLLTVRARTRWLGITGLIITGVVALASVSFFLETRAAEIFDLASSSSWEERGMANVRAMEIIAARPWTGAFGYHAWDDAGYAHNALSAWTEYGLFGFISFLLAMFTGLALSVSGYFRYRAEGAWLLALYMNLICIVLALASEPIMSSVFPPLAWGFTIRALRSTHFADRHLAR